MKRRPSGRKQQREGVSGWADAWEVTSGRSKGRKWNRKQAGKVQLVSCSEKVPPMENGKLVSAWEICLMRLLLCYPSNSSKFSQKETKKGECQLLPRIYEKCAFPYMFSAALIKSFKTMNLIGKATTKWLECSKQIVSKCVSFLRNGSSWDLGPDRIQRFIWHNCLQHLTKRGFLGKFFWSEIALHSFSWLESLLFENQQRASETEGLRSLDTFEFSRYEHLHLLSVTVLCGLTHVEGEGVLRSSVWHRVSFSLEASTAPRPSTCHLLSGRVGELSTAPSLWEGPAGPLTYLDFPSWILELYLKLFTSFCLCCCWSGHS